MPGHWFTTISETRWVQWTALGLVTLLIVFFAIQTFGKAYRDIGNDLTSYLDSARAMIKGENPYDTGSPFPYIYPLFLTVLLLPGLILPYWVTVGLWYALSIWALFHTLKLLVQLAGENGIPAWNRTVIVPLTLLCLLLIPVLQNNLLNGQVNLIVLWFSALFLHFQQKQKWLAAAVFLAAATAIKLIPGILFLYLVTRRDWRTLLASVCATVGLCLLPIIFCGERIFGLYDYYFREVLFGTMAAGDGAGRMFLSLSGFITWLLPSLRDVPWLYPATILLLIPSLVTFDTIFSPRRRPFTNVLLFSLYFLIGLLLLPVAETHHLVFIIPGVAGLLGMALLQRDTLADNLLPTLPVVFVLLFLGIKIPGSPFAFLMVGSLAGLIVFTLLKKMLVLHL